MTPLELAENEVKLACKKENPDWDGKSFDYGCSCYQSALKAYKSVCEDGHSGFSYSITRSILIRLLNELPLTPINDTEDVWDHSVLNSDSEYESYQCKRKFSLFKTVDKDGNVKYHDTDRAYAIDIKTGDTYHGWVCNVIDEMFPITMPYYPKVDKYKVYTEEFIAEGYLGDQTDYNTRGVLYCVTPEGEKVEINRYYADTKDSFRMKEISREEYEQRKAKMKKEPVIESDGEIEQEKYVPVEISINVIKDMIKNGTWKGSLEEEEVMYNLEHNLYPEDYTKELNKILK
jgi:hypothetical protein